MSDKPDIVQRTAMDVAREMISQPALFSEFDGADGFTPPAGAIQRYTGDRAIEAQMLKVGALRLLGASDRQIEQLCHVTRRSIAPMLAQLEKHKLITPLKERLAMACGDNAERSSNVLRMLLEKVEAALIEQPGVEPEEEDEEPSEAEQAAALVLFDGEPPPPKRKRDRKPLGLTMELAALIKAVGTVFGISTEKFLLTTGQATEIVETRVGAGREEIERWFREHVTEVPAIVTPIGPAKDCESSASRPEPQQTAVPPAAGHVPDTSGLPDLAAPAAPAGDQVPPREGGGGGPADPPEGGKGDDSTAS